MNDAQKRRDPPRNEARFEIQFRSTPRLQMFPCVAADGKTPAAALLPPGTHSLTVYASQLAEIRRLEETEADEWARAQRLYVDKKARHEAEVLDGIEDADDRKRVLMHKPYRSTAHALFRDAIGRDLLPVWDLKILRELPPPEAVTVAGVGTGQLEAIVQALVPVVTAAVIAAMEARDVAPKRAERAKA